MSPRALKPRTPAVRSNVTTPLSGLKMNEVCDRPHYHGSAGKQMPVTADQWVRQSDKERYDPKDTTTCQTATTLNDIMQSNRIERERRRRSVVDLLPIRTKCNVSEVQGRKRRIDQPLSKEQQTQVRSQFTPLCKFNKSKKQHQNRRRDCELTSC